MKTAYIGIGINHFVNFPASTLSGCLKDIEHSSDYFKSICTEISTVPEEMADEKTCKEALLAFKGANVWPENFRGIICLSTHGSHIPSKTEKDGYDEITVCRDFDGRNGGILDDWWYNFLQGIPESSRVYLLADTCMSTGLTRTLGLRTRYLQNPVCGFGQYKRGLLSGLIGTSCVDTNDDYPGILFPGCAENGTSSDTADGGALTCAFLKALKASPKITNRQLIEKIRSELKHNGFSQKPVLQCAAKFVEENFFLKG